MTGFPRNKNYCLERLFHLKRMYYLSGMKRLRAQHKMDSFIYEEYVKKGIDMEKEMRRDLMAMLAIGLDKEGLVHVDIEESVYTKDFNAEVFVLTKEDIDTMVSLLNQTYGVTIHAGRNNIEKILKMLRES